MEIPVEQYEAINRAWWDERAGPHARSGAYDVERLVADAAMLSQVVAYDLPRLGRLDDLDVVHLQCHVGTDTLSLARLGARSVTGLDLSSASLAEAAKIAARAGIDARWVCSPVYDAARALGTTYDLVYTGIGAINWLPSIARWAETISSILRPGGRLFIRDAHPMMYTLADDDDGSLQIKLPYFETLEPIAGGDDPAGDGEPLTYVDTDEPLTDLPTREWNHGLGEIIQAVLDAGMELTSIHEDTSVPWPAIGVMEPIGGGEYALPTGRDRLPTTFTLQARKR